MREQILDKALLLADGNSWERLTLQQVALAMQISLADIYCHFRTKDELVDAWFDRADMALLSAQISKELPACAAAQPQITAAQITLRRYLWPVALMVALAVT
jgi:AcrR family transcriptional regulator